MYICDLLDYYKENRNEYDEIDLIAKQLKIIRTFRKYIEVFTGNDLWACTSTGAIYTSKQVIEHYEIPEYDTKTHYRKLKDVSIVQSENYKGTKSYYKKIDNELFVNCDIKGRITQPIIHSLADIYDTSYKLKIMKEGD